MRDQGVARSRGRPPQGRSRGSVAGAGLMSAWAVMGLMVALAAEEPVGFPYDAHGRRDPLVPLYTEGGGPRYVAPSPSEPVVVEGIVFHPSEGSVAIINGEIIREGETVGGIQVLHIERERVTLVVNGQQQVVPLVVDEEDKGGE